MNRTGAIIVAVWGGFLATLCFWLFTDFALANADWCAEAGKHCVREWVGALSGWAAAIGALIAAAVTLPALQIQAREAQRQTSFLLGDAEPTFDVMEDESEEWAFAARVINWNRRAMLIHSITIIAGPDLYMTVSSIKAGEDRDIIFGGMMIGQMPFFDTPVRVSGWTDRNQPPHERKIVVCATSDLTEPLGRTQITLQLDYTVVGEVHSRRTATADLEFFTV
ncbi:hypothetical protein JYU29_05765 [Tianweitania sp. BSSL-BM11]|uniref:Uncharacterized protein n=1 Tax=Tianweitania aestuarii TaxID=2814886 RepID=A0ABS5RT03_9HYPH|nr:hypothetical protein [Tianweitania aestuarii]MBS9720193.1 hypothetical protein [Tianweitania aestuarii]